MGAQNDLKIFIFFTLGDNWDTLLLWNDPGGTQEQIVLQNMLLFLIFYMLFELFPTDFLNDYSWSYDETKQTQWLMADDLQNSKQIISAS